MKNPTIAPMAEAPRVETQFINVPEKKLKGLAIGSKVTVTITGEIVELQARYEDSSGIALKNFRTIVKDHSSWEALAKDDDEDETDD